MSEQIFIDRTTTWHAIGKDVQQYRQYADKRRSNKRLDRRKSRVVQ